jgi:hypothetical protein
VVIPFLAIQDLGPLDAAIRVKDWAIVKNSRACRVEATATGMSL